MQYPPDRRSYLEPHAGQFASDINLNMEVHMRFPRITIIAAFGIAASLGCYRATVETGLTPSEQVIRKESASAWLGGLVGPEKVEAQKQCPNGVAQVKTEQSLLNQVVAYVTLGIYTPMTIQVTCARSTADSPSPASGIAKE